jgi:DNA-binding NtrC family response regulator/predicted ATPase/class 3 adenylate cyclase
MPRRRLAVISHPTDRLVGHSPPIRALRSQIRRLVAFDTLGNPSIPTLLLQGETGTGKGLVARIIHDSGPRAPGPFIEVNCAAIPETLLEAELFGFEAGAFTDAKRAKPGLIEAASGGTLFLDEIDALPLPLQGKFLKVVEEKRLRRLGAVGDYAVDVKLIAATQMGLGAHVEEGRFRPDLYHRLAVLILELVPLRRRGKDIVILAEHLLRQYAEAHGVNPKRLSREANAWLLHHAWPGNVRELSHLMERATLLCLEVTLDHYTLQRLCIPSPSAQTVSLLTEGGWDRLDEPARIRQALMQTQGNVVGAARLLGMSRSALRYRLRRHGIGRHDADLRPAQTIFTPAAGEGEGGGVAARHDPAPSPLPEEGRGIPTSEQRPVSVLAIDLAYPKTSGAEALPYEPWTMASRWERSIIQKVQGFGGILLQHNLSLFIVAFGIPHTLDHMPQRAVQAAVSIQRLLAEAALAASGEPCPELRLAVHVGEVFVDGWASLSDRQLLAVGDTLSLSVRLLGLAAPGELLVSPPVGRLVGGWFELQDRPLPFGAVSGDQAKAHAIVGAKARPLPLAMHAGQPLSRFVGRDYELGLLHERLAQAEHGHGQVVGIVGEPGVGKSRLVFELLQELTAHRVMVLEGRCLPYGHTIPYLPVIDFLKSYFHIDQHDSSHTIRDKLASKIVSLDRLLEDTVPYLLSLLAVSEPTAALQQMDPQIKQRRTFAAIKRLLLRESLDQPVLLVGEDLHWMDSESQAFFSVLSESLTSARMLLLVTHRPEVRHPWGSMASYTQLRLPPLTRQESEKLLTALLGERAELQSLREFLLAKSEGNPFFLEELVQALVDQGVLQRNDSGGAPFMCTPTTPPVTEIELPLTVQEVLVARIDRLPAEEKVLLQTAAVIGKGCPFNLLKRVMEQPDEELYQRLSHLQQGEFIYEQAIFPESSYTFKHALTQEVAYNSLLPEQRRTLHERTAQAIEALFQDRLGEHYSELAHHYRGSGNTMKAVVYLQLIGQQAVEQSAYTDAIGHVTTALELHKTLPDTLERRQQELALQMTLGPALMGVKGFSAPEVEQVYARGRALCQEVGETPQLFQVLHGLSAFYALQGKLQTLRDLVEQRLSLARRQQAPDLLLPAHIALGHTLLALGEVASARLHLEQGMARYRPEPHQSLPFGGGIDPIKSGRCHAALVLWLLGHPDQAQENLNEMLSLFEGSSNPYGLPVALLFAAILHQFRGEDALTLERAEAAITHSITQGFPQLLALGTMLRGWALTKLQRGMTGIAQIQEGLVAWRATGAELLRPYALALLAEAYNLVGQANEGLTVLDEALATVQNTGERWWEAELHRLKGGLLFLLATQNGAPGMTSTETAEGAAQGIGGADQSSLLLEAEAHLLEALKIARRQQAKSLELRAALSLGALWHHQGQRNTARGQLAEVYGWFTEGFDTADLRAAKALLDEPV